jgi:hypothetical protein
LMRMEERSTGRLGSSENNCVRILHLEYVS